jgi:hypothetical protein
MGMEEGGDGGFAGGCDGRESRLNP